jgi:hypothetical protein
VNAWDNFFVAQVGASAALAGLLFVGLSINMTRILQFPVLLDRALQALTLLIAILMIASLTLVPGPTSLDLGVEILVVGGAAWAILTTLSRRVLFRPDPRYRGPLLMQTAIIESASGLYLAAGVVLLAFGEVGVDVLVPAMLLSYVVAIMISWVLLVEINR